MRTKSPAWFAVIAALALLWNLAGLAAVVGDLRLSAADIAALPEAQQLMYKARPGWSVLASVVAVLAGTAGCLGLLLRRRFAVWAFGLSLLALVVQDFSLFVLSNAVAALGMAPLIMQGLVFLIALGLLYLGRHAAKQGWLA